jgi:hypothetical protein
MHLFHFSTCFKEPRAHHQENQLYQYNIWYVSIWPSSMQVGKFLPDLHTRWSPTQSDTYQMLYWCNWFSWWWAWGCSKHVEMWNKSIRAVHQVGYLQDLYQDARSAKHKIWQVISLFHTYSLLAFSTLDHLLGLGHKEKWVLAVSANTVIASSGWRYCTGVRGPFIDHAVSVEPHCVGGGLLC